MTMMMRDGAGLKAPEMIFVDGAWVAPTSGRMIDVISPMTEEKLLSYPEAGTADIDRAVEKLFGYTFLLDRPTPKRLAAWRSRAQPRSYLE